MIDKIEKTTPSWFTIGEIRLLKTLYKELSIDELAIFFRKTPDDIRSMIQEFGIEKKEVSNG